MTKADLEARMKTALTQGGVGFGPLELLIIGAALSTLVSWIVTRCLNQLWPEHVQNPGWFTRHRLRAWCGQAVREAAQTKGATLTDADEAQMTGRLYEAALSVGRGMTAAELTALKAHAMYDPEKDAR